ncbi:MAG: very short patch repair endonuclease [Marinifilaceae bacterium]|nr:very short patch repair endonuclease [Marinifilaceae bacterium]
MAQGYEQKQIRVPRFSEANGFYTTKQRSELMSKIRAKDTKPEIRFRAVLWSMGLRYRKNVKALPGTPDIVMRKYKLVVFIDDEFWHGYQWETKKAQIKSNKDFWIPKIERNMQRDKEVNAQLAAMGFYVLRFWNHQIKNELPYCIGRILEFTSQDQDIDFSGYY